MKRRIFALLAALCLLAGCAGKTEPDAPVIDPAPPTVDPTPVTPTEPSEAEQAEARLRERIAGMSIEEKVGQMFFVRCPEMGAAEDVAAYHLGGLLLFGRDYKDADGGWLSAEELTAKLESYQAAAELPLFIGSDEEGGTVTRASRDPKLFAAAAALAAGAVLPRAAWTVLPRRRWTIISRELLALGINVNLAPVCDVSTDAGDFIYARSFGRDAAATSEFVTAAVGAIRDAGVAAVLKHFPGYGNNADTHTGVAIDKRPYETFEQSDFLPFRAGMGAGAPFVLVSHNVVECMDAALPASLSPAVHEVLRETLGFDGIVITDDLAMDAVKQYANGEAAVLAVLAGNDMLITSGLPKRHSRRPRGGGGRAHRGARDRRARASHPAL